MYNTSADYIQAAEDKNRELTVYALTGANGSRRINANQIYSLEITEVGTVGNKLTPGVFPKSVAVFKTHGMQFARYPISFYVEIKNGDKTFTVPLGKFYIVSREQTDNNRIFKHTAYSVPTAFEEKVDITSTDAEQLAQDITDKLGRETWNGSGLITEYPDLDGASIPAEATNGQMLGWIAGYSGHSVRVDRSGTAIDGFVFSEVPVQISSDKIYQNGLDMSSDDVTIGSYACEVDGQTTLTAGSGYGVTFSNPFMTQDVLNDHTHYIGKAYRPMTVKWFGDPAIEVGDIVTVNNRKCYVMQNKLVFDGGFYQTLYCYADKEKQLVIGKDSPLMKKINLQYSKFYEELASVMNTLIGSTGGYFSFIDANRNVLTFNDILGGAVPAGFQIADTPTVEPTTKGWQFVQGGLYNSTDGFRTVDSVALTADGYIIGDRILANSIAISSLCTEGEYAVNGVYQYMTFDENGLTIAKDGAAYGANFNTAGMRVTDTESGESSLIAEGDSVKANNLTALKSFTISNDLADTVVTAFDIFNETGIGVYWVGGEE